MGLALRYLRAAGMPRSAPRLTLTGSYRVRGTTLQFVSRYPLDQPGYRVRVDRSLLTAADRGRLSQEQPGKDGRLVIDLDLAPPTGTPLTLTVVESVYPSAEVLPENLLRFYLHFSAPMSRGEAYTHIRLLDAAGQAVADPFLELDEELWSGDGRRFTLLFDPGRIKRGLKPREEVGPVLKRKVVHAGDRSPTGPMAQGNPLAGEFRKSFRAGPPDQDRRRRGTGKSRPPPREPAIRSRSRFQSRSITPSARRLIVVRDSQNRIVRGVVSLERVDHSGGSRLRPSGQRAPTRSTSAPTSKTWRVTPWDGRSRSTWPGRFPRG